MSYTRATLGDLAAAQDDATRTGAAATDAGARAVDGSGQLQAGIERVTDALLGHFTTVAGSLREESQRASAQLGTADWEGQSREMAVAAETSLHSALTATLEEATAGTEQFRATMTAEATAFVEGVRGQFSGVMSRIDEAFQQLASAETAFADHLQEADASVRFDG